MFEREKKKKNRITHSYWLQKKKKKKKRTSIIVWKIISCSLIVNPMGIVRNTGRLKESRIINFWKCARCVWKVMNIERKKKRWILFYEKYYLSYLLERFSWKTVHGRRNFLMILIETILYNLSNDSWDDFWFLERKKSGV